MAGIAIGAARSATVLSPLRAILTFAPASTLSGASAPLGV
jgi:hypothetical protein